MTPKRITLHCSDTPNGVHCSTESIRKWHIEKRGWSDIGYHFVIELDGSVHPGRPLTEVGAHVEGHNQDNVGICLVGTDMFAIEQISALKALIEKLCEDHGIPFAFVYAHREWDTAQAQGKTCPNIPGESLRVWLLTGSTKEMEPYLLPHEDPAPTGQAGPEGAA